jgi:hypothetical protein
MAGPDQAILKGDAEKGPRRLPKTPRQGANQVDKQIMRKLSILILLAVAAVAAKKNGRIYNLTTAEVVTIEFEGHRGNGRGSAKANLKSGEKLMGEFVTIEDGTVGWGSIYGSVYGGGSSASANATGMSIRKSVRRRGSIILAGDAGTTVDCEYVADLAGRGTGACKDNKGVTYRLVF